MLIKVFVDILLLSIEGKDFKWEKPEYCPKCKNKLWGHGFRERYFFEHNKSLYLKRLICCVCGTVIMLMPEGYFKYYRYSSEFIYAHLKYKLLKKKWKGLRQLGQHWLNKFLAKMRMDFPEEDDLVKGLTFLYEKDISFFT